MYCLLAGHPSDENSEIHLDGSRETLTSHTDFLNKNATNLQITSYNFPETEENMEVSVDVVKGSQVHQKSPSQHMADLCMLKRKSELSHLFEDQEIEYIRVDGASDEGPSHLEVQFLWTERHLMKKRKVTVVTSRCSGDSYLNRVELQNSHLTKGHSNTFIPSTLQGDNTDEAGKRYFFHELIQIWIMGNFVKLIVCNNT